MGRYIVIFEGYPACAIDEHVKQPLVTKGECTFLVPTRVVGMANEGTVTDNWSTILMRADPECRERCNIIHSSDVLAVLGEEVMIARNEEVAQAIHEVSPEEAAERIRWGRWSTEAEQERWLAEAGDPDDDDDGGRYD